MHMFCITREYYLLGSAEIPSRPRLVKSGASNTPKSIYPQCSKRLKRFRELMILFLGDLCAIVEPYFADRPCITWYLFLNCSHYIFVPQHLV
jgi:hypothetical protein